MKRDVLHRAQQRQKAAVVIVLLITNRPKSHRSWDFWFGIRYLNKREPLSSKSWTGEQIDLEINIKDRCYILNQSLCSSFAKFG